MINIPIFVSIAGINIVSQLEVVFAALKTRAFLNSHIWNYD